MPVKDKTLTVRNYRLDDIPYMIDRAADFIPKMPHYKGLSFSRVRLDYLLKNNLNPQSGFGGWILADSEDVPRGFGAGYCVPAMISTENVANDVVLYVEPEWRSLKNAGLLIKEYVKWAKSKQAKIIIATDTSGLVGSQTSREAYDKFLGAHGFENVGSLYWLKQ